MHNLPRDGEIYANRVIIKRVGEEQAANVVIVIAQTRSSFRRINYHGNETTKEGGVIYVEGVDSSRWEEQQVNFLSRYLFYLCVNFHLIANVFLEISRLTIIILRNRSINKINIPRHTVCATISSRSLSLVIKLHRTCWYIWIFSGSNQCRSDVF